MARHVDSPELFGVGIGSGTSGDIDCDVCKTKYNVGADQRGNYMDEESVTHTRFAGLTVCDCCFEAIEHEIEARMPEILEWYRAIVESQRIDLAKRVKLLNAIGGARSIQA